VPTTAVRFALPVSAAALRAIVVVLLIIVEMVVLHSIPVVHVLPVVEPEAETKIAVLHMETPNAQALTAALLRDSVGQENCIARTLIVNLTSERVTPV
jgi:hypothetical protein